LLPQIRVKEQALSVVYWQLKARKKAFFSSTQSFEKKDHLLIKAVGESKNHPYELTLPTFRV
jgi:hypothetical protein